MNRTVLPMESLSARRSAAVYPPRQWGTRVGSLLDVIPERHDASPGQIALAWLLKRSPIMLPIPASQLLHMQFVAFGRRSGILRRLICGINAGHRRRETRAAPERE